HVTGVQTCALPISAPVRELPDRAGAAERGFGGLHRVPAADRRSHAGRAVVVGVLLVHAATARPAPGPLPRRGTAAAWRLPGQPRRGESAHGLSRDAAAQGARAGARVAPDTAGRTRRRRVRRLTLATAGAGRGVRGHGGVLRVAQGAGRFSIPEGGDLPRPD